MTYQEMIGKRVEICWTEPSGIPSSAEGVLASIVPDPSGTTIALLDWGYGVDMNAKDFWMGTNPDITVPAGQVHWFDPYRPRDLVGPCPHTECEHLLRVIAAWGPSEEMYELIQCDGAGGCGCRAWKPYGWTETTARLPFQMTREMES